MVFLMERKSFIEQRIKYPMQLCCLEPGEEKTCTICYEAFHERPAHGHTVVDGKRYCKESTAGYRGCSVDPLAPARLPCVHLMCTGCALTWFEEYESHECPCCHQRVVKEDSEDSQNKPRMARLVAQRRRRGRPAIEETLEQLECRLLVALAPVLAVPRPPPASTATPPGANTHQMPVRRPVPGEVPTPVLAVPRPPPTSIATPSSANTQGVPTRRVRFGDGTHRVVNEFQYNALMRRKQQQERQRRTKPRPAQPYVVSNQPSPPSMFGYGTRQSVLALQQPRYQNGVVGQPSRPWILSGGIQPTMPNLQQQGLGHYLRPQSEPLRHMPDRSSQPALYVQGAQQMMRAVPHPQGQLGMFAHPTQAASVIGLPLQQPIPPAWPNHAAQQMMPVPQQPQHQPGTFAHTMQRAPIVSGQSQSPAHGPICDGDDSERSRL